MPTRGFLGSTSETFGYSDGVGNITSQSNIGLESAEYNFLDLPKEFEFSTGTIHNYYTADGQKLMSVTDEDGVGSTTHYYEDGFEYENDKLVSIYHPEGRVVFNGELETEEGILTIYPEWVIRDHLGNTRVRFVDKDKNGEVDIVKNDTEKSELIGSYHYYPFGMTMEGKWTEQQGEEYDYKYNGKELEEDLGLRWYDYGARWYDASLGRWTSVDPLADLAPDWSPYRYGFNNPIIYIDEDGLFETRDEAREYKRLHDTQGTIRKNKETDKFEIHLRGSSGGRITTDEDGNIDGYVTAPETGHAEEHRDFTGFFGTVNYYWNGGHFDGQHYSRAGYNDGISPIMGTAPVLGTGSITTFAQIIKGLKGIRVAQGVKYVTKGKDQVVKIYRDLRQNGFFLVERTDRLKVLRNSKTGEVMRFRKSKSGGYKKFDSITTRVDSRNETVYFIE
ncbi:MAG TPA: RHS repeat-associated core domain-containing protein [Saprospiraceae bacterium]|nr:RHS repeat-associated core domain-containing protein [Saprospiraceae bacterium]